MAKKMVLVPESWLRHTKSPEAEAEPSTSQVSVIEPQKETDLSDLAQFLPKGYRNRGRILLHYLQAHLKLNEQQRVIYEPNNTLGSHILDLVKYFASPFAKDRPVDAPKFAKLLATVGVPSSAIAKKREPFAKDLNYNRR